MSERVWSPRTLIGDPGWHLRKHEGVNALLKLSA